MITIGPIDLLLALLFIVGAVALAFGPYYLARSLFLQRNTEKTDDLAGSVLFRIGALHPPFDRQYPVIGHR